MSEPRVIPANTKMYVALVEDGHEPDDEVRPKLVLAWGFYWDTEYGDFGSPTALTVDGELQATTGQKLLYAESADNLVKMIKRMASK